MKIGTKGRYAVMAMIDIAAHASDQSPVSIRDISERQEISTHYLEQILRQLRQEGLLTSTRGAMGGYILSRPVQDIAIADIIKAANEPLQLTRCNPSSARGCMSHSARCLSHSLWEELGNQMMLFLKTVSLEDVLEKRILGKSGLFFPDSPIPKGKVS